MGVDCRIIAKMKDGSMAKIEQDRYTAFIDHETLSYVLIEPTDVPDALETIQRLSKQGQRESYEITWLTIANKALEKHCKDIEYVFVQTDLVGLEDHYYTVERELK